MNESRIRIEGLNENIYSYNIDEIMEIDG